MKRIFLAVNFFLWFTQVFAQPAEVFSKSGQAVQGYDVVSYFTESKPVKGKSDYTFVWHDATWFFSNQQNLESFKTSPEKFAPQFGGYCAYGMAEGHKAPTSPDAWTIVDGKLYLNYNTDVRSLWSQKQAEYIQTANQNWSKLKNQE